MLHRSFCLHSLKLTAKPSLLLTFIVCTLQTYFSKSESNMFLTSLNFVLFAFVLMVSNLLYCHILLLRTMISILLLLLLETFTVVELLKIDFGCTSLIIALILSLTTFAKNQFTMPTLTDFSETQYRLHYKDFLLDLGLFAPIVLTDQKIRNTIVLFSFFKLY